MGPRLYLGNDIDLDRLVAVESGRMDDAWPPDRGRGAAEPFGFLDDEADGRR